MKAKDEKEVDELAVPQVDDEKAWTDIQLVKRHAERGSREKFVQALSKVPKVAPDEADKIDAA